MPDFEDILRVAAVTTSVLQFLSGIVICRNYIQKKSTGDSSGFPFICGFLSCSFWLRYGFLTHEGSLMTVNTVGAGLFLIYTLIYYVFTVNKKSYLKQFGFIVLTLVTAVYCTNVIEEEEKAIQLMGIICCVVTVIFFAAPLTMLVHVVRVQNSESLPFPLIIMSFLVSIEWLVYGVIIGDTFIQIPNFLGCVLSLLQLCLFVIYPPKTFSGLGYKLVDQSVVF